MNPLCLLAAACLLMSGLTQPVGEPTGPGLSMLDPGDPGSYLTVGEDLADRGGDVSMARETLALAVVLAAEREPELAASAAISLAGIAESREQHEGLWSLAVSLDPRRGEDWRWLGRGAGPGRDLSTESARVLGLLRRNDPEGPEGATVEVRNRIVAEGQRLGRDPVVVRAVLRRWLDDTRNDPCRGRLIVRDRSDGAYTGCPRPDHHHGRRVDSEWRLMVGIEMSLREVAPANWSAQRFIGLDRPVVEWTPEVVARLFGVSADRPFYRSGRWVGR